MPVIRPQRFSSRAPVADAPPEPVVSPNAEPASVPVGKEEPPSDIALLIQTMGKCIAHAHLYGPNHSVAAATADQAYAALARVLEEKKTLTLTISENTLFANGEALPMKNPLMGTFAQSLAALDTGTLIMEQGMTRDEFQTFAAVLAAGKKQGGDHGSAENSSDASALDESRFSHLKTQKTVVRSVNEDEVVVSRRDAEQNEALKGFQGEQVQQIVAFLKGQVDTPAAQTPLNDPEQTATHASQLADLIMKSAVIGQQAASVEGGETLGDIVVGCLRRTFDALSHAPSAHTRKGKRAIKKTLTLLEKDVLDRLRETAREGYEKAIEDVSTSIADMTEEVQASDMAAQYVKKRRAAGEDEDRLLRFMRKQGSRVIEDPALLKDQLVDEGLSEEGWQELIVRSGIKSASPAVHSERPSDAGAAVSSDTRHVSTLISLLDDLTTAVKSDSRQTGGLMKALEKISGEVDSAIAKTDEKVEALARFAEILAKEDISADDLPSGQDGQKESADSKRNSGQQRLNAVQQRSVLRILSEITQELSQPLSVIECTLGMLENMDGDVIKTTQGPLIGLARESVARMDDLIQKIARVTGLPGDMYPDHALLDALNTVSPSSKSSVQPFR